MRTESNVRSGGVDAETTIDTLKKFLRGELSAVETYGQALGKLARTEVAPQLEECKRSHEQRAEMLRQQVVRLGGEIPQSSGPWGAFAKLVEGGAKILGERAAIAALEEGEDHGLRLYRDNLSKLDARACAVVDQSLLPEQERTHRVMSALKHRAH